MDQTPEYEHGTHPGDDMFLDYEGPYPQASIFPNLMKLLQEAKRITW